MRSCAPSIILKKKIVCNLNVFTKSTNDFSRTILLKYKCGHLFWNNANHTSRWFWSQVPQCFNLIAKLKSEDLVSSVSHLKGTAPINLKNKHMKLFFTLRSPCYIHLKEMVVLTLSCSANLQNIRSLNLRHYTLPAFPSPMDVLGRHLIMNCIS